MFIKDELWLKCLRKESPEQVPDDVLPGEELLVYFSDGTLNTVEVPALKFPEDILEPYQMVTDEDETPPWLQESFIDLSEIESTVYEDISPVQFESAGPRSTKKAMVMESRKKRSASSGTCKARGLSLRQV